MTPRTLAYLVVALLVGASLGGLHFYHQGRLDRETERRQEAEARERMLEARLDSAARAALHHADSVARAHTAELREIQRAQRELADEIRDVRTGLPRPDPADVAGERDYWRETATLAVQETVQLRAALGTADSLATVQDLRITRLQVETERLYDLTSSLTRSNDRLSIRVAELERDRCIIPLTRDRLTCGTAVNLLALGFAVAK